MLETVTMRCGHCGNVTTFTHCGGYSSTDTDPNYEGYWAEFTYTLYQCQTCSNPTLIRTCTSSEDTDLDDFFPRKILYPEESRLLGDIPFDISEKYKEVLKVRTVSPRSCAVMIGITLEAICHHEKALGKTLAAKINNLAKSDCFPVTLVDMIDQLRKIRNLGAHDAKDMVTADDVPLILSLLEAILEYLYVAPGKLKKLKEKLEITSK